METIAERCQLAFQGVPNETRKSRANGTTLFERVLPGPDRMYPDTDSAPISVSDEMIETARRQLPIDLQERLKQLSEWQAPPDSYTYILRNNLMPVLEQMSDEYKLVPRFLVRMYAHTLKSLQGRDPLPFGNERISDLLKFIQKRNLNLDILPAILKVLYNNPNMVFSSILSVIGYKQTQPDEVYKEIPVLRQMFGKLKRKSGVRADAEVNWIMGSLRKPALGNVSLKELRARIEAEIAAEVSHA